MQDLLLDGVAGRLLEVHFGQAAGSRHHGGDVVGGDPLAGLLVDEREGPADARGVPMPAGVEARRIRPSTE